MDTVRMTPALAIADLRALGWSDHRIAVAAGVTQPTICRLRRMPDAVPLWNLGDRLITLAQTVKGGDDGR